jgi:hypothetical protein
MASLAYLFSLLASAVLGVWIDHRSPGTSHYAIVACILASFFFGALVGFSEILSRYRDEPLLAAITEAGLAYLTLNGLISLIAFAVLREYPDKIFPGLQKDIFLTAVTAGFGGMVIFRSKLFTFKSSDGNDYAIGPAIVLDTILKMIDSKIDRRRATDRQQRVFDAVFGIEDFPSVANYFEASLLSFQNLSQDDKTQISSVIDQYRKTTNWPNTLKVLGLGFAFLTIAGEENFDLVIFNLKRFLLSRPPTAPQPQQPVPPQPNP